MFGSLKPQPEDKILALMSAFRDDPRGDKIDLGVGVYRDAQGRTPVMRAVKSAERQLVENQTTKSYTGLTGDPAFADALGHLVLGNAPFSHAATPGGTGAVHQALQLVRMAKPDATLWLSEPTWPNHTAIAAHLGIRTRTYRYYDTDTGGVWFSAMAEDLERAAPGDAVMLHGCCHNPTGADLALPQWREIAEILDQRRALPIVDLAYLGFAEGLDADAAGLHILAEAVPELLVAVSCSKNFGLYRDRVGLLLALSDAPAVQGSLAALNRLTYSFPPDHGARVVQMILDDPEMRADWQAELDDMRTGMQTTRHALADALRERSGSDRFGFLAGHHGMFSLLPATSEQIARLREDHGIYVVGDGRMNVAGLRPAEVPVLADAIVAVGI
ncbi:aromatic amino acid transaminase [Jannaschia aquimarina]|uniref:Aminotransferase n=1 Tax=Jannaschia aquimarina TaxID=935700 RepID=A0A0D1EJK0_9RHOB|nr:amino acid aminotransferase [Jannaschia aquimarina]KIT17759.1 Aromatic-amino-acid aminotransferase [Jannaschia aquimarina]SNS96106.1 aromatic amino acid aminotransferase apoenzyme [Jannaschia aquimarina]